MRSETERILDKTLARIRELVDGARGRKEGEQTYACRVCHCFMSNHGDRCPIPALAELLR